MSQLSSLSSRASGGGGGGGPPPGSVVSSASSSSAAAAAGADSMAYVNLLNNNNNNTQGGGMLYDSSDAKTSLLGNNGSANSSSSSNSSSHDSKSDAKQSKQQQQQQRARRSTPIDDDEDFDGNDGDSAQAKGLNYKRYTIPRDWKPSSIVFAVSTLLMFLLFMILEYSVEHLDGAFCGRGGFNLTHAGYLTECFVESILFVPMAAMFIAFTLIWCAIDAPWSIRPVAERASGRPFTLKLACLVVATLAPLTRLLVRDLEYIYTRDREANVLMASDVVRALLWILCSGTCILNWRNGRGHPFHVRLFFAVSLLHSIVKMGTIVNEVRSGADGTLDFMDVTHIVVLLCCISLFVLAWLGWRDGSLEFSGTQAERATRARSLPPMWQIWDLIKEDKWLLLVGLILSAVQGVLLSFALLASADLMGGETKDRAEATKQLLEFLGFSFAVAISTSFQQAIFGVGGQSITRRIKSKMFRSLLLQNAAWLHRRQNDTGRLTSRLNTDSERFGNAVTVQMSAVVKPMSQALIGIGFLFALSWRLSTVLVVNSCILMVVSITRSVKITVYYSRLYSDELANVSGKGVEIIKGLDCVHQYLQEKNEHVTFRDCLDKVYVIGPKKEKREAVFEGFEHLLISAIAGLGLWYGAILVQQGAMPEKDLIGFALVAAAVVAAFEDVLKILPEFLDASGPALRCCQMINAPVTWDFDTPETGIVPEVLLGEIEFKGVQFSYPGASQKILGPNLNFKIKAGESAALVGESGCGKSTSISLVQRQYHVRGLNGVKRPDTDQGTVFLDGVDIRKLNRHWLMERLGIVAQQSVIFNSTIYDNVTYGKAKERWLCDPHELAEQRLRVIAALKRAAAWDEFVNPHPPLRADGSQPEPGLGLDFAVGEDGGNLSGGQKQRVSIARLIYKGPSLFILDEVTSALDAGSERKVMDTLIDISRGKTTLAIAHRLNTIKHSNALLVFSKAGVIQEFGHHEIGTEDDESVPTAHEQLLAIPNGAYRSMFEDQTF
jgi:ABC-type multidrug transport system fused ATPase/permease subunit